MSLKQTACFSYKWLAFWVALLIVEGKDPSSLLLKGNRGVMMELTKAEDESTVNAERSVESGLRRKDPSSLLLKGNRGIMMEPTKAEDESTVNAERSVECGLRKLTKRSNSFDASWLQDQDSPENNCQIFSITTAATPVVTARTTTKKPEKATPHRVATGPWFLPFWHYYPLRQQTFYRVFYPYNTGTNVYRPIWYKKFQRDDSSEEKRR